MTDDRKIVAISFLTAAEVKQWGHTLRRTYALPSDTGFDDLLRKLDKADEKGKF